MASGNDVTAVGREAGGHNWTAMGKSKKQTAAGTVPNPRVVIATGGGYPTAIGRYVSGNYGTAMMKSEQNTAGAVPNPRWIFGAFGDHPVIKREKNGRDWCGPVTCKNSPYLTIPPS